jgi:hypothetical protein
VADNAEETAMSYLIDWFIPAFIGLSFTVVGGLKLYGLLTGIVGGAEKPLVTRLCGT